MPGGDHLGDLSEALSVMFEKLDLRTDSQFFYLTLAGHLPLDIIKLFLDDEGRFHERFYSQIPLLLLESVALERGADVGVTPLTVGGASLIYVCVFIVDLYHREVGAVGSVLAVVAAGASHLLLLGFSL